MSDELAAQMKFTKMIAEFILWVYDIPGYTLTFGEAYRTKEQAEWYAQRGQGIAHSLHTERLAIDLNLFINGQLQEVVTAYKDLGVKWESLGGCWGGRFTKIVNGVTVSNPDSDHFSLEFGGVK